MCEKYGLDYELLTRLTNTDVEAAIAAGATDDLWGCVQAVLDELPSSLPKNITDTSSFTQFIQYLILELRESIFRENLPKALLLAQLSMAQILPLEDLVHDPIHLALRYLGSSYTDFAYSIALCPSLRPEQKFVLLADYERECQQLGAKEGAQVWEQFFFGADSFASNRDFLLNLFLSHPVFSHRNFARRCAADPEFANAPAAGNRMEFLLLVYELTLNSPSAFEIAERHFSPGLTNAELCEIMSDARFDSRGRGYDLHLMKAVGRRLRIEDRHSREVFARTLTAFGLFDFVRDIIGLPIDRAHHDNYCNRRTGASKTPAPTDENTRLQLTAEYTLNWLIVHVNAMMTSVTNDANDPTSLGIFSLGDAILTLAEELARVPKFRLAPDTERDFTNCFKTFRKTYDAWTASGTEEPAGMGLRWATLLARFTLVGWKLGVSRNSIDDIRRGLEPSIVLAMQADAHDPLVRARMPGLPTFFQFGIEAKAESKKALDAIEDCYTLKYHHVIFLLSYLQFMDRNAPETLYFKDVQKLLGDPSSNKSRILAAYLILMGEEKLLAVLGLERPTVAHLSQAASALACWQGLRSVTHAELPIGAGLLQAAGIFPSTTVPMEARWFGAMPLLARLNPPAPPPSMTTQKPDHSYSRAEAYAAPAGPALLQALIFAGQARASACPMVLKHLPWKTSYGLSTDEPPSFDRSFRVAVNGGEERLDHPQYFQVNENFPYIFFVFGIADSRDGFRLKNPKGDERVAWALPDGISPQNVTIDWPKTSPSLGTPLPVIYDEDRTRSTTSGVALTHSLNRDGELGSWVGTSEATTYKKHTLDITKIESESKLNQRIAVALVGFLRKYVFLTYNEFAHFSHGEKIDLIRAFVGTYFAFDPSVCDDLSYQDMISSWDGNPEVILNWMCDTRRVPSGKLAVGGYREMALFTQAVANSLLVPCYVARVARGQQREDGGYLPFIREIREYPVFFNNLDMQDTLFVVPMPVPGTDLTHAEIQEIGQHIRSRLQFENFREAQRSRATERGEFLSPYSNTLPHAQALPVPSLFGEDHRLFTVTAAQGATRPSFIAVGYSYDVLNNDAVTAAVRQDWHRAFPTHVPKGTVILTLTRRGRNACNDPHDFYVPGGHLVRSRDDQFFYEVPQREHQDPESILGDAPVLLVGDEVRAKLLAPLLPTELVDMIHPELAEIAAIRSPQERYLATMDLFRAHYVYVAEPSEDPLHLAFVKENRSPITHGPGFYGTWWEHIHNPRRLVRGKHPGQCLEHCFVLMSLLRRVGFATAAGHGYLADGMQEAHANAVILWPRNEDRTKLRVLPVDQDAEFYERPGRYALRLLGMARQRQDERQDKSSRDNTGTASSDESRDIAKAAGAMVAGALSFVSTHPNLQQIIEKLLQKVLEQALKLRDRLRPAITENAVPLEEEFEAFDFEKEVLPPENSPTTGTATVLQPVTIVLDQLGDIEIASHLGRAAQIVVLDVLQEFDRTYWRGEAANPDEFVMDRWNTTQFQKLLCRLILGTDDEHLHDYRHYLGSDPTKSMERLKTSLWWSPRATREKWLEKSVHRGTKKTTAELQAFLNRQEAEANPAKAEALEFLLGIVNQMIEHNRHPHIDIVCPPWE